MLHPAGCAILSSGHPPISSPPFVPCVASRDTPLSADTLRARTLDHSCMCVCRCVQVCVGVSSMLGSFAFLKDLFCFFFLLSSSPSPPSPTRINMFAFDACRTIRYMQALTQNSTTPAHTDTTELQKREAGETIRQ